VREWNLCLKEGTDFLKNPGNLHCGREAATCLYWRNREATERGGQARVLGKLKAFNISTLTTMLHESA